MARSGFGISPHLPKNKTKQKKLMILKETDSTQTKKNSTWTI